MTCCACARCLRSSSAAGHATLRRGAPGTLRASGRAFIHLYPKRDTCVHVPDKQCAPGRLLTQPIQMLPLCACAKAAEAWTCVCACSAPVCSPGYLWRRERVF